MKDNDSIFKKFKSFAQFAMEHLKKIDWPFRMLSIVVVLLLAIQGQIALTNNQFVGGLLSYFVASIIFIVILIGIEKTSPPSEYERNIIKQYVPVTILWSIAFLLIQYVLPRVINAQPTAKDDYLTSIAWLLSIATFSAGVLWIFPIRLPRISFDQKWLRENGFEFVCVALIGLTSFALRLYQVLDHPYPVLKDEGQLGVESLQIISGYISNFFNPGWATNPTWLSMPYVLSISVFGNTIFAIRILSVLMGTLVILVLYFLVRSMFDRWTALIASGLLVGLPVHLQFSRLGVTNMSVPLFACVVIFLVLQAIKKGTVPYYLLAGIAAGATFYTYTGARLVFAYAVFIFVFHIIRNPAYLRSHIYHLCVFLAASGIVAIPILYYLYHRPDYAMALYNGSGIIQTGWLMSEPANSGRTIPQVLLDQFAKSTLVFISQGAPSGFFNSPQPYLTPWQAVFFVLGMAYSISQILKPNHIIVQMWFWSIVILGSMLTLNPPSSERLLGSLPPMAIFVALGLNLTLEAIKRMELIPARFFDGLRIVLVLVMVLQGASFYFGDYQQGRYFERRAEEIEIKLVQSLMPPCNNYPVYLLTQSLIYADYFPVHDYLIPEVKIQDLNEVTPESLSVLPKNNGLLFVAIPENQEQLKMVANAIPGGKWTEVPRKPVPGSPREVLFYTYQIPASQADSCPIK